MGKYPQANELRPDEVRAVLAVNLDQESVACLTTLLRGTNWLVQRAESCREAAARCRHFGDCVVVCAPRMVDGDWRILLSRMQELPNAPAVIVASRLAEEHLWGEVLNLGGYDVLPLPFDRMELERVLDLAWWSLDRGEGRAGRLVNRASAVA